MLHRNFIDGQWVEGGSVSRDINPSNTDDVVGEFTYADRAQAVAARTYALRSIADRPPGTSADLCDTTACQVFQGMRTVSGTSTTVHEQPSTDAAVEATAKMIQFHGGIGYTWEHDAHFFFKRAKRIEYQYGDAGTHRERIARLVVDGA